MFESTRSLILISCLLATAGLAQQGTSSSESFDVKAGFTADATHQYRVSASVVGGLVDPLGGDDSTWLTAPTYFETRVVEREACRSVDDAGVAEIAYDWTSLSFQEVNEGQTTLKYKVDSKADLLKIAREPRLQMMGGMIEAPLVYRVDPKFRVTDLELPRPILSVDADLLLERFRQSVQARHALLAPDAAVAVGAVWKGKRIFTTGRWVPEGCFPEIPVNSVVELVGVERSAGALVLTLRQTDTAAEGLEPVQKNDYATVRIATFRATTSFKVTTAGVLLNEDTKALLALRIERPNADQKTQDVFRMATTLELERSLIQDLAAN